MDTARFDALARRVFALARPRRIVLAILASGGIGVLLRDASSDAAAHQKRRRRHRDAHAQDIAGAIKIPPGKRFAGCRFVAQTCGTVRIRRGKKILKKVLRCCANSSCHVGKNQRGRCSCDSPCYADPDGDGICTLIVPPPCVALNGACTSYEACCDPGAGPSGGNAICIGDICTGRGFCPPASLACAVVKSQKGSTQCNALPDGTPQCCKLQGIACTNDCQCCGSLRCEQGTCVPCVADNVACPAGCAVNAECRMCCAGNCRTDGLCGPPQGCALYGQLCSSEMPCCDEVPCISSRCRFP